jgi:hypothetical protein
MIFTAFITLIIWFNYCFCVNFDPLPPSFTDSIRVSPTYGKIHLNKMNLGPIGGGNESLYDEFGVGIKWGAPFRGLSYHYALVRGYFSGQVSAQLFSKTNLVLDSFKVRYYRPLIDDETSIMAVFLSVGVFNGNAIVSVLSESPGKSYFKERLSNGWLADIGWLFSYEFNPEWHVFLQVMIQTSFDITTQDLGSTRTDDAQMDMSGAALQLGTSIKL